MFCKRCGCKVNDNASFCGNCGTSLEVSLGTKILERVRALWSEINNSKLLLFIAVVYFLMYWTNIYGRGMLRNDIRLANDPYVNMIIWRILRNLRDGMYWGVFVYTLHYRSLNVASLVVVPYWLFWICDWLFFPASMRLNGLVVDQLLLPILVTVLQRVLGRTATKRGKQMNGWWTFLLMIVILIARYAVDIVDSYNWGGWEYCLPTILTVFAPCVLGLLFGYIFVNLFYQISRSASLKKGR